MGESAEGKGLGRVWEGLGEDRRVVGNVGGWGHLGNRLIQGLSKAYPGLKDNQGLSLSPG